MICIRLRPILSVDISVKVFFSLEIDLEHPLRRPVGFFFQVDAAALLVDSKIQSVLLALDGDHDVALAKINRGDFYVC